MQLVSIGSLIHTLNQIDQFENMYRIHELKSTQYKFTHVLNYFPRELKSC